MLMFDQLKLKEKAKKEIKEARDLEGLEKAFKKYLGRKGELTGILRSLKDLPKEERKKRGQSANQIKKEIGSLLAEKRAVMVGKGGASAREDWIDVTAPGVLPQIGSLHPLTLIKKQLEEIFQSMGFSVLDGPEVETEYYNFDALNIPEGHPARDVGDTFWLKDKPLLLRTHTSPMQARYMGKNNPPLRVVVPGRCFRHEATDASHDVQFYQMEGLMVGSNISVADFKGVTEHFLKKFFGPDVKMRLRSSYFPFVEPGFEVDMRRKKGDWLEIMGAGMVHQNVFKAAGYVSGRWQGFAFGVGLDRLAMLKYQVDDIRLFYSGDLRFLRQF